MSRNIASARYPQPPPLDGEVTDQEAENSISRQWHETCIKEGACKPETPQAERPHEIPMEALTQAISHPRPLDAVEPVSRRPGLLGWIALLLWAAAVCLGIVAPLAGMRVEMTLVLAVLVASGIASLLSLPAAAGLLGRGAGRESPGDRRHRG